MTKTSKPPAPYRFSFNLAEFIADTHHLGPLILGCLLRLMMFYWRQGPLKDDNPVLAGIVGLQPKEWGVIRSELEPFFIVDAGQWIHEGVDRELEAAYTAINAKKDQTRNAREALKKKREAEKQGRAALEKENERLKGELAAIKIANNDDNNRSDNDCDSGCDIIPTTNKEEPPAPQAKERVFLPSSFAVEVLAAERSLGMAGGAE